MRRVTAVLPFVLAGMAAGCTKTNPDAPSVGTEPQLSAVAPAPGQADPGAHFRVEFSVAMDEGQLLAAPARSETVVLVGAPDVEAAAAALARARLTVAERALLVPADASVSGDARVLELVPGHPLEAGVYFLLVSPRLRDAQGRRLPGNGARFQYTVADHPAPPRLVAPAAGTEAPLNLGRVLVRSAGGNVSIVDGQGAVVAGPVPVSGEAALPLRDPLVAGALYRVAGESGPVQEGWFAASACRRSTPVAFEGGKPRLFVRDSSVDLEVRLDAPAELEVQVAPAGSACGSDCSIVRTVVACAPPPCATPSFGCAATVRVDGLAPGAAYTAVAVARDLQGFETRTAPLPLETAAGVPRLILSEVMAAPGGPTPRTDGEYVELLNLGPGAARLDALALVGDDGIVRPLLAAPPPQPVLLASGARALAVGAAFDPGRYPALPGATPILRAATQRLLGSGLRDDPAPPLRLVLPGDVPLQLATFPGGSFACPAGTGLQRDESLPPDAEAAWTCGASGGTPGTGPE